ncbi:MAG: HNH endonuclease [Clostridiales bacterium]|nr:HNH endonuclease [Clostridiales bacterium]
MNRSEIISMLIERDGAKCANCGCALLDEQISVDYVIPQVIGGGSDLDNKRLLCSRCNAMLAKPFKEYDVECYLVDILKTSDNFRNIITTIRHSDMPVDIIAERKEGKNWQKIAIEVKTATTLTLDRIHTIIAQMNMFKTLHQNNKYKLILAIFARLSEAALNLLQQSGIEVWDVNYMAENFAVAISRSQNKLLQPYFKNYFSNRCKSLGQEYIEKLKNCAPGIDNWKEYQNIVGEILSYLFCPPLSSPMPEKSDYSNTNRRDFIFPNYSDSGYWSFLRANYKADYIVVDAKNSGKKIAKKDVLQIANYLKIYGTGLFGLIVSRNECDMSAQFTLREAWVMDRKLIVNLLDNDLEQMLLEKIDGREPENVLRQKIEDFRLSF